MTTDLRINGSHQLVLRPAQPVEQLVLSEMADAAEKGAVVTLRRDGEAYIVSVDVGGGK